MAVDEGLEPSTLAFRAPCSSTELIDKDDCGLIDVLFRDPTILWYSNEDSNLEQAVYKTTALTIELLEQKRQRTPSRVPLASYGSLSGN